MEPRAIKGRTRAGRLRLVDAYLSKHLRPSRIADVGYGATPDSLRELLAAFPEAVVIGYESDRNRLIADLDTRLVGGFELPAETTPFDVVRAINVLRGYSIEECNAAHAAWLKWLNNGGVLVEGTTTPDGDVACFFVKSDVHEQLVMSRARGSERGFAPWMLRDWLPKLLRRSVAPGTLEYAFFEDWTREWSQNRGGTEFQDSVEALSAAHDVKWEGDEAYDWLVWNR